MSVCMTEAANTRRLTSGPMGWLGDTDRQTNWPVQSIWTLDRGQSKAMSSLFIPGCPSISAPTILMDACSPGPHDSGRNIQMLAGIVPMSDVVLQGVTHSPVAPSTNHAVSNGGVPPPWRRQERGRGQLRQQPGAMPCDTAFTRTVSRHGHAFVLGM